jgi:Holliday junction resolvasome RuvABC endonuclease subunit
VVILGLDLGTTVGWALRRDKRRVGNMTVDVNEWVSDTWDLREAGSEVGVRMRAFRELLREALKLADAVAYEDVSFAVGQGGKIIGYQTGILLAECAGRELLCADVGVPALKKFSTGNGRATKPDMIVAARKFGGEPKDDNEADAILVAEWLAQNMRIEEV